jgi:phosphoglycerol transferase MdoB-like AlkP superfamily enzyme
MLAANFFSIFKRPALLSLCVLAMLSASRLFLVKVHWDRVAPTEGIEFILLQGVRFDLILLGMLFGPVFLLKPWFHTQSFLRAIGRWLWPIYLGLASSLIFFVEASTQSFIAEFDTRPNYIFVEYLEHPREVFATLSGSHFLELLAISSIAVLLAWFVARWLLKDPRSGQPVAARYCLLATPVIVALLVLMIRSSFDHHPANPSIASFSQDSMVNQLPLNSPYSLLYAIYEKNRDSDSRRVRYGVMDDDEVLAIILREANIEADESSNPAVPTLHHQTATHKRDRPLNLVIIVEESLGAEFVGSLGGRDLTPELDQLASEGIWLNQLYATGTRSARGIGALITGFTPTPQLSVLKLADTQSGFFTLAGLLQNQGYQTGFIYGGSAHFDNMKRFFLNNGFQSIIEQKDFQQPDFIGPWGVSDEDLFKRAHEEFSNAGDQPFFSLVFTTSHHKPFDIPENKVAREPGPDGPRETAVKYADYSLGRFIELARQSNYWEDTVFLITSDHNSRVYGDQLVPVERFHIPGVIIGGAIEPRVISGISSQIDMLPTLLSLIGVSADHPAIGRDLTQARYADGAGRAMMQFYALQAYMEGDRVVVLQPEQEPWSFRRVSASEMVVDFDADPAVERKALAYALWGPMMIRKKAYHR